MPPRVDPLHAVTLHAQAAAMNLIDKLARHQALVCQVREGIGLPEVGRRSACERPAAFSERRGERAVPRAAGPGRLRGSQGQSRGRVCRDGRAPPAP